MKDTLLFTLISFLKKEELHSFKNYLQYSAPEKNKILLLLKIILDNFDKIEQGTYSKEDTFNVLYPEETYSIDIKKNDDLLRKSISELTEHLEYFIAQESFKKDKAYVEYYFLHEVIKRHLTSLKNYNTIKKLMINRTKEVTKILNETSNDENYFYIRHLYSDLFNEFYTSANRPKAPQSATETFQFLYYYTLVVFFRGFTLIHNQIPDKELESLPLYNELTEHIKNKENLNIKLPNGFPIFEFYKMLLSITKKFNTQKLEPNDPDVLKLHSFMHKYFNKIQEGEKSYLYSILADYYVRIFHTSGDLNEIMNYRKKKCEIDKMVFHVDSKRMPFGVSSFPYIMFYNIYKNALKVEMSWADEFFENYHDSIDIKYRKETIFLCSAYRAYYLHEYDLAKSYFTKKNSTITYHTFKQEERVLKIMIYFDNNELEETMDLINNAEDTLTQKHIKWYKKLKPNDRNSFLNFYKLMKRIVNLKKKLQNKKSKPKVIKLDLIFKLKQVVISESILKNRDWIFEKIEELNLLK